MRRISDESSIDGGVPPMKIEHWLPESQCSEFQKLDFRNMLGVCMGNAGQPYSCTTCDSHRKDKMLTINPLDKNLVQQIKYESHTGKIYSENEQINEDLNDTLNLNYEAATLVYAEIDIMLLRPAKINLMRCEEISQVIGLKAL